jgi:hypothetical protein
MIISGLMVIFGVVILIMSIRRSKEWYLWHFQEK